MTELQRQPVNIAGAGLAGSLLALMLARRGYPVDVYERRSDMRKAQVEGGRSINLALSTRGLTALRAVGLDEAARSLAIPMAGRMIHSQQGELNFQPYGKPGQAILSISRRALNEILLDVAEAEGNARFHFEHKVVDIGLSDGSLVVRDGQDKDVSTVQGQLLVGADGAFSKVRRRLQRTDGFDFEQDFLPHAYKELTIPATAQGDFALEPNALHIWPRHDFMLIALPNLDRSFTCTLFMAKEGPISFEQLQTPDDVRAFFAHWFPDTLPLMPELDLEFFENPTGSLLTIRCAPYHYGDRIALVGDAAHAIVPFFGQGMNASFEDCRLFTELLDRFKGDWSQVLPTFSRLRKPNADALAQLSLNNYIEMRDSVASPLFKARKKVDLFLYERLPDEMFMPLYDMVTFSNIPYADAIERAHRQDRTMAAVGLGAALVGAAGLGYLLSRRRR